MTTLLQDIYQIERELGIIKAQKDAYSWYVAARNDERDNSLIRAPEQKGYLQAGKISIFTYNPKGKKVLDYYDKKPVVISLGQIKKGNKIYELGINLNFIPSPYKWYILNTINKLYSGFIKQQILGKNSNNALLQRMIYYRYSVLKQVLRQYKVSHALRIYIPSRKSRVYISSYETWSRIAFLSIENFEGITYNEMIQKYNASKS